jgi:hypothetical protein
MTLGKSHGFLVRESLRSLQSLSTQAVEECSAAWRCRGGGGVERLKRLKAPCSRNLAYMYEPRCTQVSAPVPPTDRTRSPHQSSS